LRDECKPANLTGWLYFMLFKWNYDYKRTQIIKKSVPRKRSILAGSQIRFWKLNLFMESGFFEYIQQLEKMAFFSGYPLIYAIAFFIAGDKQSRTRYKKTIITILPYAYALVGTFYLGLQLTDLYPDYSLQNIKLVLTQAYLTIWAVLSILFWIPPIAKRTVWSLIHSLVFLFILVKDLTSYLFYDSTDNSIVKNEMKVYTDSLLLNLAAFVIIALVYFLLIRTRRK